MGLREDKKVRTREAISHLATKLFLERGYDAVTTAEIANLAGVSVPTLFKYFPTKESLVFDEDAEREKLLIDAVEKRRTGQTILDALLELGLRELAQIEAEKRGSAKKFMKLVESTPELSLYEQRMWLRHEKSLAKVIANEASKKVSHLEARAVARFVLDSFHRSLSDSNPKAALQSLFKILSKGWSG